MRSGAIRDTVSEDLERSLGSHLADLGSLRDSTLMVTGGTGFVGSWLAETAVHLNDHHGFGLKLILQSPRATTLAKRAPALGTRKEIFLQDMDVRNTHEIPAGVRWLIHAAATPDGRVHASDPTRTIDTIVRGTSAVLDAAMRSSELEKVLNVSSGLVYGPQPMDLERIPESYKGALDPASFTSAYAESKRLAETMCAAYGAQYRLPITTARMFAFVGPYQLLDRPWAVNNLVRDATQGGNLRIHGDGLTVRSYMYPSDMAVWLLKILVKGQSGEAYNVGHPHGVTLLELAQMILEASSKPIKIQTDVLKEARLRRSRFVPDVAKAERELGLRLTVDLKMALSRMLAWAGEQ